MSRYRHRKGFLKRTTDTSGNIKNRQVRLKGFFCIRKTNGHVRTWPTVWEEFFVSHIADGAMVPKLGVLTLWRSSNPFFRMGYISDILHFRYLYYS